MVLMFDSTLCAQSPSRPKLRQHPVIGLSDEPGRGCLLASPNQLHRKPVVHPRLNYVIRLDAHMSLATTAKVYPDGARDLELNIFSYYHVPHHPQHIILISLES